MALSILSHCLPKRFDHSNDPLTHVGLLNVFGTSDERYPRLDLERIQQAGAHMVLSPDEPYLFTADDGPEVFPDVSTVLVPGRELTWYGPSPATARAHMLSQMGTADMYTATLHCGTVLSYEARSFLPVQGEAVPCHRHGYCVVDRHGQAGMPTPGRRDIPRARPRGHDGLREWLRGRSRTTFHALRQQRSTLRMIAAAERDGLVAIDLEAGTVAVHAAAWPK